MEVSIGDADDTSTAGAKIRVTASTSADTSFGCTCFVADGIDGIDAADAAVVVAVVGPL